MATEYKPGQFWNSRKTTDSEKDYTSFSERKQNIIEFDKIKNRLANPVDAVTAAKELIALKEKNQTEEDQNLITSSQVVSVLDIIRKNATEKNEYTTSTSALLEKYNEDSDSLLVFDKSLSPEMEREVVEMHTKLKSVSNKKLIKMYFDAYMSPLTSDIVWRLGTATDTVTANENYPTSGAVYTRSNIHVPYTRSFLHSSGDVNQKDSSFTNFWFPPYKIGPNSKITRSNMDTAKIRQEDIGFGFDQENFVVSRDNLVYRDIGFKALNDYIQYLQWITEGVTGIVSTDLTEWDLSVYMQENMMTTCDNGNALKVYLNYGIYTDNPLADSKGNYTDDKALCFNVAGSSVSKIEGDNKKIWRPSDFPLTPWWTPYEKDNDFTIKDFIYEDGSTEVLKIPYMSIYDEVNSKFNYSEYSTKDIIEHQDFLGLVLQSRHNPTNYFYNTFYYIPGEGVTEYDILAKSFVTKTAGMDEKASKTSYSLDALVKKAKVNQISDGGWYGSPNEYGSSGGFLGKAMIEATMSNQEKTLPVSLESKALKQLEDNGYSTDVAKEDALTSMANKDATQMSNLTGICRWSPAIYGGPHGAGSSPNSAQGFFEPKAIVSRNIPRVDPDFCFKNNDEENEFYFSSEVEDDYYKGVNALYGPFTVKTDDNAKTSSSNILSVFKQENKFLKACSPSKTLHNLIAGSIESESVPTYTRRTRTTYLRPTSLIYNTTTNTSQFCYTISDRIRVIEPASCEMLTGYTDLVIGSTTYSDTATNVYKSFEEYVPSDIDKSSSMYSGKLPFLKVTYDEFVFESINIPQPNDFPNMAWKIVHHNFYPEEGKEEANAWEGPFWQRVTSTYGHYDVVDEYDELRHPTGFVLRLIGESETGVGGFSTEAEQNFAKQILLNKNSYYGGAYLYFFAGSRSAEDVPTTMFRAPIRVSYYRNSYVRETTYTAFGKEHKITHQPEYTYMPFIEVDLANATVFEDALNLRAPSNDGFNGENIPTHLQDPVTERTLIYRDSVLQLFRQEDEDELDKVVSFTIKDSSQLTAKRFFEDIGYAAKRIWNFIANKKTNLVDSSIEGIEIDWVSQAEAALYGYGMVSSLPGLNPDVIDEIVSINNSTNSKGTTTTSTKSFDFKSMMCYTDPLVSKSSFESIDDWFDQPVFTTTIDELTPRFNQAKDFNSELVIEQRQAYMQYMTFGGPLTSFTTIDAPTGITQALKNMYTRCKFWPDTHNGGEPYAYIDMSVPFRNFLSVLITQKDFFSFAEDTLLNLVSFSTMKNVLLNYVDRAVLKASGIKVTDTEDGKTAELITPDPSHVLYNYWIEVAGKNFVNEDEFDTKTDEIKAEIKELQGLYTEAISIIQEICKKDTMDWCLKDFIDLYTQVAVIKEKVCSKSNKIDGILFAYLNMLYYYRLYFIGHRFNKSDGTMWIMRSLESILEMAVPTNEVTNPVSPNAFEPEKKNYTVAFYEIQNTYEDKVKAAAGLIDPLEKDSIIKVYVKVNWVKEEDYNKYIETEKGSRILKVERTLTDGNKITKYAKLPENGTYQLIAEEYLKNELRLKWNAANPNSTKKPCLDQEKVYLDIEWETLDILWDVFGTVNVDHMLEYATDSISPQDLYCLMQEGADFWTIPIDESQTALAELFKTKVMIKPTKKMETEFTSATTTLLGPSAFSLSPIIRNANSSEYGLSEEALKLFGQDVSKL